MKWRQNGIIAKGASTNETKGPMQGAAQVENLVIKLTIITPADWEMRLSSQRSRDAWQAGIYKVLSPQSLFILILPAMFFF